MPLGGGQQIDALYWELELRSQGVEAGAARTKAVLKEIDLAAERTKRNLNDVGGSSTDYQKRQQAIGDLNKAFAAGLITEAQYVEQSKALGIQLRTVAPAAAAAAAAVAAEGTAAAGAAVATEAAAVSVRGLLAAFGPLLIAAIGIQLGAKLITAAWNALTGGAREAKKATDDLIDSLNKQRQASFDASLAGRQASLDAALAVEQKAQERVQQVGPRRFDILKDNRSDFTKAAEELAKASKAVAQARDAETEAQQRLNQAQADEAQSHNQRLAGLVSEGNARKDQTAELRKNADAARAALAVLNSFTAEGADARQQAASKAGALSATESRNAVEAEQVRLQSIIKLQDDLDKKKEKTAATDAKAASAQQSRFTALRDQMEALKASLTGAGGDDFQAKLQKIDDQIKNLKPTDPQLAILKALRAEIVGLFQTQNAEQLTNQLRDLVAASTVTAVDDLQNALGALIKKFENEGAPQKFIDEVKAIQQPMIDATARSEELSTAIQGIQRDLALGFNLKIDLAAIQSLIDKAIAARNALHAAAPLDTSGKPVLTKAEAQAQADLDKLLALELELREKIRKLHLEALGKTESVREKTGKLAGDIANAANAAFGLASAFLGADDALTKMLGSIGQIAGGISSISKATNLLEALPAIGQLIGGGLALGNLLFGDSPAEKARAERTKENTEALRALTNRVGELGLVNVTGEEFARLSGLLADPEFRRAAAVPPGARGFSGGNAEINAALERFGFSAAEFAEIAKRFGVALDPARITLKDIEQVVVHLKETQLTQFAESFSGQMQAFAAEAKLFDLTTPIQQLAAFRQALDRIAGGGGILSEALANFDLTTAEGVEAAKKVLQDLFTQFQALAPEDIPSFLGGLTPEEFLSAIEKWKDLLEQASVGTGGFADTFAGQMAKLEDEIRLFDIKDPIAQIKAFRLALDGIKGKGGILADLLDKFDLTNPEGIGAAIKALQDLFTQVTSGTLNPNQFGGLTGQELIDAILKATDLLKGAEPGGAAGSGTGGFNVETKITEVTGSRMAALLTTANVFAERTAQNTAIMVGLLGGTPLTTFAPETELLSALVSTGNTFAERTATSAEAILAQIGGLLVNPPPVSPPVFVPYGGQPVNNNTTSIVLAAGAVQVTLSGPVSEEQASAAGVLISESVVREMDRRLGGRAAWARRAAGDIRII